jgi:hypothetical protein
MINPPIIVVSDDVDVFETVSAAESYIEPPDVAVTRLYDRDGRPLQASVASRGPRFFRSQRVHISEIGDAEPEPDRLRALLLRFLRGVNDLPESADRLRIDDLWDRAVRYKTR